MKITADSLALYTAAETYALDAAAIASGIPSIQLMKRAGRAAYDLLLERFPAPAQITVYCGGGKNGGDGYILAALAAQRLHPVQVIQLTAPEKLAGEARQAYDFAVQEGVAIRAFDTAQAPSQGVIVDALLGIGLRCAQRRIRGGDRTDQCQRPAGTGTGYSLWLECRYRRCCGCSGQRQPHHQFYRH
jgi:hydroxyethylthiazole kinase-like uncharacterized protein yjeF